MLWRKKPETTSKQPPTVSEELIARVWDLTARVEKLEGDYEERMDELKRKYASVTTATRRLEAKQQGPTPCEEEQLRHEEAPSVYSIARRAQDGIARTTGDRSQG